MTNMEGKTHRFCLREGFSKMILFLAQHLPFMALITLIVYICASDFLITLQLVDCPTLVPHPSL